MPIDDSNPASQALGRSLGGDLGRDGGLGRCSIGDAQSAIGMPLVKVPGRSRHADRFVIGHDFNHGATGSRG